MPAFAGMTDLVENKFLLTLWFARKLR